MNGAAWRLEPVGLCHVRPEHCKVYTCDRNECRRCPANMTMHLVEEAACDRKGRGASAPAGAAGCP